MQRIGRLLVLAFGAVIGFAIAEVAVRSGLVHDPVGTYLGVDGDTASPRARLLLLGDSFVDKRGEGGFHTRLVSELRTERVSVANLAVSGTGPAHYREVLLEHGAAFEPDVVVLFYFAGNDLINVIRYQPPPVPSRSWRDWIRPFVHRSRLYHAVTDLRNAPEFDYEAMLADGHDPDLVARARTGEVNPWLLLIPRDVRARYLRTNLLIESEESRAGASRLREILRSIAAESVGLGARLQIVVFPATTQISRSHFDFYTRAGFDPDPRMLTGTAPQDMVAGIAAELDVPVLDLLPAFRAHAGEALYRPYDSHLTEQGNALAARETARFLARNLSSDD